jgi:hypothetical protein
MKNLGIRKGGGTCFTLGCGIVISKGVDTKKRSTNRQ